VPLPAVAADPERMNPAERLPLDRLRISRRALAWILPNSFSTVILYKPASFANSNSKKKEKKEKREHTRE
jgi:hypothetical protein